MEQPPAELSFEEDISNQISDLVARGLPDELLRNLLIAFSTTNAISLDLSHVRAASEAENIDRGQTLQQRSAVRSKEPNDEVPVRPLHEVLVELLAVSLQTMFKAPARILRCTPNTRPSELFFDARMLHASDSSNTESSSAVALSSTSIPFSHMETLNKMCFNQDTTSVEFSSEVQRLFGNEVAQNNVASAAAARATAAISNCQNPKAAPDDFRSPLVSKPATGPSIWSPQPHHLFDSVRKKQAAPLALSRKSIVRAPVSQASILPTMPAAIDVPSHLLDDTDDLEAVEISFEQESDALSPLPKFAPSDVVAPRSHSRSISWFTHNVHVSPATHMRNDSAVTPQATHAAAQTSSGSVPTGPIFAGVCVLLDLHLAPAAVQMVVIEALRTRTVTVSGKQFTLPAQSLLLATHDLRHDGWQQPMPRPLLDSFAMEMQPQIDLLGQLFAFLQTPTSTRMLELMPTFKERVHSMPVRHVMTQYIRDIVVALRQHPAVAVGPSPSTTQVLTRAACAHAAAHGVWDALRPADVDSIAVDVLCARVLLRTAATSDSAEGANRDAFDLRRQRLNSLSLALANSIGHDVARRVISHLIYSVLQPPK